MSSQLRALEAFAADADLLHLESLLKRFNLFEAIGVIRQELRHSDLLACLLDPHQSHGLGSNFLREFLSAVQETADDESTLATLDLDALNLNECYVEREWHHIDILVADDVNRLAIIIENKIVTKESPGQLTRYFEEVSHHASYQNYQIVALYLTPEGDEPSFDRYLPVSYTQVCEVIGQVIQNSPSKPTDEILMVVEHYTQMLRRHIVSDSDVAELCRSIYRKHKQALDSIFEHGPPPPTQIRDYLVSLIQQQNDLVLYSYGRSWVNFSLQKWDASLSARGLSLRTTTFPYLSFSGISDSLAVGIWVSPGNSADRQRILQLAEDSLLTGVSRRLAGREWSRVTSFKILNPHDYDKPQEEIEALISEKWTSFLQDELPRITKAVQEADWLWTL